MSDSFANYISKEFPMELWLEILLFKTNLCPLSNHANSMLPYCSIKGVQIRARNGPPGPVDRTGPPDPTRPGSAQRSFSFGPGGPIGKNCWAGRAKFFVGPARPDILFKLNVFYIYQKQLKLLKKCTKEKYSSFTLKYF